MAVSVNDNKKKSGLQQVLEGIGSFFGDSNNSAMVGTMKMDPKSKLYQPGWAPGQQVPASYDPQITNARSNGSRGVGRPPIPTIDQAPVDPVAELYSLAEKYGYKGSSGVDYSGLMDTITKGANQNDARTAAMYAQLQKSIAANAAPLGQIYDNTGAAMNKASDAASGNAQAAAQASTDMLTKQLADLGIGAAVGTSGGSVAGDASTAVGNIEQNRAANVNQNTAHKGSALAYNNARQDVAGLTGAEARGKIQQALAEKIASLGVQQAQSRQNDSGSKLDFGMKIKSLLNPQDPSQTPEAQQALAKFIAAQQQQAFDNNQSQSSAQRAIWNTVFKQTGDQAQADAAVARLTGQGMGFGG